MKSEDARIGELVGAVSKATGLTVRTLHHWDAEGIASASGRTAAGYRVYLPLDVDRVRRVQRYRQLGMTLDDVRSLLDGDSDGRRRRLELHRASVISRADELREAAAGLDRLLVADEHGPLVDANERAHALGSGWDPSRTAEARALWGDTRQWGEWAERSADRTAEDWHAVILAVTDATGAAAEAVRAGVDPRSPAGVEAAERHRSAMSGYFTCSPSMHVLITRRFTDEPGFVEYHESIQQGLGAWLRVAAEEAARQHGVEPDEALWE